MVIFIIYVILSAFGIAGTEMWNNISAWPRAILCVIFGWIFFPCMIMFTFGKFMNDVNNRY